MNNVSLVGRLVADPELTYTPGGKAKANFAVAVNQGFGEKRTTEFIDCVAWEKAAEKVADQGRKGFEISIGGRISARKWQDKEGKNRKTVEVVANTIVVGKAPSGEAVAAVRPPIREQFEPDVDDIPF